MKAAMKAAIYLRSSKDRSDVSISAQRRELTKLATDRKLDIVAEFTDVVESAKTDQRPGFQQLITAMRESTRPWRVLLIVDTSRLSRRRYVAQVFKHEAKKRGVEIVYSKLPDMDPITSVILESVLEAMDEVHSLMSREKGLAGMAENVRQGYRAGGRAPRGYRLKTITTGAVRDGAPVNKSILIPGPDAVTVQRYLKARATGKSRHAAMQDQGLNWPKTTVLGIEWNALTYAGHTVWNVLNGFDSESGYETGRKRRPRSEWVINRNTHEALITDIEAEALLANLENKSTTRRTRATYLLTSLLKTPDGTTWQSDGKGNYRIKGGAIAAEEIETAIIKQMIADLISPEFTRELAGELAKYISRHEADPAAALRQAQRDISARINRMMELAARMEDADPALREIAILEKQRKALQGEIDLLEKEHQLVVSLRAITERDINRIMHTLADDITDAYREHLKDMIRNVIEQIELTPDYRCTIRYRMAIDGRNKMASPRESDPIPYFIIQRVIDLAA